MATIKEHNKLIKVVFGGTKHFKHILTRDEYSKITQLEKRYPISRRPVCEGCESLAWWDKGWQAFCPSCGTITKNPITLSEYYTKGCDLDKSGFARDKEVQLAQRDRILPLYGKGGTSVNVDSEHADGRQ